jgi:hypothetical protein
MLVFVDIPRYGEPPIGAQYQAFLESLGGTVFPFALGEGFFQPTNWSDRYHPNIRGAEAFTNRFVDELEKEPLHPPGGHRGSPRS